MRSVIGNTCYRNPGDAAVAGAEVEPKPPGTSTIISHGYDFPKSIEGKSKLVALVEESPFFIASLF